MKRYPECRRFLLEHGGVDQYASVDVRITPGHNPDLVVTDERGEEVRRIDLTAYDTQDALHALMQTEGFVRTASEVRNKHDDCYKWGSKGECLRNPAFMKAECPLACAHLVDQNDQCAAWAERGQCDENPTFMLSHCPVSCGWKNEL